MNPGAFVMGGGGGSGGGSGNDGNGDGGGQGANGEDGGDGANGGGANAGACGQGSGDGCPNPSHGGSGTQAGDPIDPITGRVYTVAQLDVALPGPIPLIVKRSFDNANRLRDCGLGFGWSHSFGWTVTERRRERIRVIDPLAAPAYVDRPPPGEGVRFPGGRLERVGGGYMLRCRDGFFRHFDEVGAVGKRDGGGRVYRLTRITDRNGNCVDVQHDDRGFVRAVDATGQRIQARWSGGHIKSFDVIVDGSTTRFRSYEHDRAGNLIAAVDAGGHSERFAYDEERRLVCRTTPTGTVVHFRYDQVGRAVESWCTRAHLKCLDASVDDYLADRTTKAKGFLHVRLEHHADFTEVVTSTTVRRVEGDKFSNATKVVWAGGVHTSTFGTGGERTSYTDALGQMWSTDYDADGRLTQSSGPLGAPSLYTYDERGWLQQEDDPGGGCVKYDHDDSGNLLMVHDDAGFVASLRWASQGSLEEVVMANGGVTRVWHDERGNRTAVVEPDGTRRSISHTALGRVSSFVDEKGGQTNFSYDPMGRVVSEVGPGGKSFAVAYDAEGHMVSLTADDGRTTRLEWGGLDVVTAVHRSDGSVIRYFYDRELALVRVENASGESHLIERDGEGRIVAEETFDGRRVTYEHDLQGRVTTATCGDESTHFTYDVMSRLLAREHSDGSFEQYTYDLVGRLVSARTADVLCEHSYDRRGSLVAERVSYGGTTTTVESTFDTNGKRTSMFVGGKSPVTMKRNVVGYCTQLDFGAEGPLEFRHDALGYEEQRRFPGGGGVRTEITADGVIDRVSVHSSAVEAADGFGSAVHELDIGWSGTRNIDHIDTNGQRTELRYDNLGRPSSRQAPQRVMEAYGYGPDGNIHEVAPSATTRTYGAGGRLLQRDNVSWSYDARGRVIGKRVKDDGNVRSWRFAWNGAGLLSEVRLPDSRLVSFVYDAFARRIVKRVSRGLQVESETRYTWDVQQLVGTVTHRRDEDRASQVVEMEYVYTDGGLCPAAQRQTVDGRAADWEMIFVNSVSALPELLCTTDGRVLERFEATLFGKMEAANQNRIAFRLPGQLWDEETGLCQNGFRYFDQSTGTFYSPEPLGLEASLMSYAYADNFWLRAFDPDGLAVWSSVSGTDGNGNPITANDTRAKAHRRNNNTPLHPAVAAAMPNNNARAPVDGRDPAPTTQCGDMQAFSNFLNRWESAQDPPRRCDPATAQGRANLNDALGDINRFESNQTGGNAGPRAPCPNCSQAIQRLYGLGGRPPPGAAVIQPGRRLDGTTGVYDLPQAGSDHANASAATNALPNRGGYTRAAGAADWRGSPQANAGASGHIPNP